MIAKQYAQLSQRFHATQREAAMSSLLNTVDLLWAQAAPR